MGDTQPIWLSALKFVSNKQADLVNLFNVHAFPEIMRQDREGQRDLLSIVPLQDLRSDDSTKYSPEDLRVYLMILQGSKGDGLKDVIGERTFESIGARLLCHANTPVRSAAFSMVTQPTTSKEPFAATTLTSLRLALPAYHAEVNPKVRQESLALIRDFLQRLARSLNGLKKMTSASGFEDESNGSWEPAPGSYTDSVIRTEKYKQYLGFVQWYSLFLVGELSPTASYQRHFMALKVLGYLLSDGQGVKYDWDDDICIGSPPMAPHVFFGDEVLTSLLNLVMDPFDDIRELAASILHNLPSSMWSGLASKMRSTRPQMHYDSLENWLLQALGTFLSSTLDRATLRMQGTGRADHADGFGRLYDLILGSYRAWTDNDELVFDGLMSRLEQCIETARANVQSAVRTASLHGYLIAARYLIIRFNSYMVDAGHLQTWSNTCLRLLRIALSVWEAVKDILCADAPEGYEVESQDDEVVGTKDMLSFCWRALKESRYAKSVSKHYRFMAYNISTLMHSMLQSTIAGSKSTTLSRIFTNDHYRQFGDLAFTELAELRHRGAFSTVSQTFALCCFHCAESEDPETQALPRKWYEKTLLCIQQRASALTRRSAGLPAMITGILSANLGAGFFDTVIGDLRAIARVNNIDDDDGRLQLPQVHAFNCLKDIFTDGRFGSLVEQHISSSLELAARALESDWWAIRNCGLMLMKALITRLNDGTNTNSTKVSSSHRRLSTLVYDKHQNLPDLVLRLLATPDTQSLESAAKLSDTLVMRAQRVFPALEMIEQSGIPKQHRVEIRQAAWSHLEGPAWPLRDKAAKALSYIPAHDEIYLEMESCLQKPRSTQNALHGRLLYLRYLFARLRWDASQVIAKVLTQILDRFPAMIVFNSCPLTRALYTNLIGDVLETFKTDQIPIERHLTFKTITASEHWQALTEYIHTNFPAGPASALEDTAKHRCGVLLRSCDDNITSVTSCRSIFTDHGPRGMPQNPEHADQILRGTGNFLAARATQVDQGLIPFRQMIGCWSRALRLAQEDSADVSTRQAAVTSLAEFLAQLEDMPVEVQEAPEMLDLYIRLYDSLIDDEEDVRDMGAVIVSRLGMPDGLPDNDEKTGGHDHVLEKGVRNQELPGKVAIEDSQGQVAERYRRTEAAAEPSIPLMVLAARHKLLDILKARYHESSLLWLESIKRLVNAPTSRQSPPGSPFSSPNVLLESLTQEDTTLFVEEKQNLYIDEAQEAGTWQKVLLSIDRSAIKIDILQQLNQWTIEGIEALTRNAEENEPDGPLGWTSKPGIFALGVRVLLAAEALIHLSRDKSLGIDGEKVQDRLSSLSGSGRMSFLNPTWFRMVTDTLKQA
ncbi:MAG: hypothetical protein Q9218_007155 [Villophora microphyllina]